MEQRYTVSNKLAVALVAAVSAVQVYQAAVRPIGSGEAYLYDRFVRPTVRQAMASELPDRDVLYGLLEKRSVGLFHVSPFSVRLPGVLFGVLFLWSGWQLAKLLLGSAWLSLCATALAGAAALQWGWFVRADGMGTGLALEVCAVWLLVRYLKCNHQVNEMNLNLAGACLGLSIAARLDFAIPAAVLALVFLAVFGAQRRPLPRGRGSVGSGKHSDAILILQRPQRTSWVDCVFIPAVVVALIFLVLPLSHAHAAREITPELTARQAGNLQSDLEVMRLSAGSDRIRIGTIPSVEPVVNFYRAQHRATAWERAARDYRPGDFDYYLLPASEGNWAEQRHLLVLSRDADFLLARRSSAPM
jgi:hypothetical protein